MPLDTTTPESPTSETDQDTLPPTEQVFSDVDRWQTFESASWSLFFEYPTTWQIVEEQQEPPRLYILLREEQGMSDEQVRSGEGALIQLTLSRLSDKSEDPYQILQAILEEKSPERSGWFFDPEGTLGIDPYITRQGVTGLLGNVQSQVYLHESYAFTHSVDSLTFLGIVDAMAERPLSQEQESEIKAAFFGLVDSILFSQ